MVGQFRGQKMFVKHELKSWLVNDRALIMAFGFDPHLNKKHNPLCILRAITEKPSDVPYPRRFSRGFLTASLAYVCTFICF